MERIHSKAENKFRVNNKMFETKIDCPSREKILEIAGKDPSGHDLLMIIRGKQELIKPDDRVCLSKPGLERFIARPRKVNDGLKGGESLLPFYDREYLNGHFENRWEMKRVDNLSLLHILGFELPEGYNVTKSDMVIIIPDRYNAVQLDMVYFKQFLSRADGKPIPRLTKRKFGNEVYQQWSRHRNQDNPWIIGVDCIETHVELIGCFLREELQR